MRIVFIFEINKRICRDLWVPICLSISINMRRYTIFKYKRSKELGYNNIVIFDKKFKLWRI